MIYEKLPVVLLSELATEKSDSTNHVIADYVLTHQKEIKEMGIKELAAECHVGTGSVSRFVRDIGLKDFTELKNILIKNKSSFVLQEGEDYTKDWTDYVCNSLYRVKDTLDFHQVKRLCEDIQKYEKISAYGMLKAESAAINLQVDMLMMGKRVYTSVAYADQMEGILNANKNELIIIFSYTGSFFEYHSFRNKEQYLKRPKIWMICSGNKTFPDYVNEVLHFDSELDQRSHPYQLEAVESLIVQTYAHMYL